MVKAIRVHQHGGPEVLKLEDVEIGEPKKGEIKVKNKAIGVNFSDVYMRNGSLERHKPTLPYTPGMTKGMEWIIPREGKMVCLVGEGIEAVGVVIAVGPEVTAYKVGDMVAYASMPMGAYAEEMVLPANVVIPVPPSIDPVVAAAAIFKGLTAAVLIRNSFKVGPGNTIIFHAAADGVGSLACQWANALGATVIGTVSTKEKAILAKEDGCHHVINYKEENFVDRVMEITSGKGVDVVYESVGKDTFEGSIACLKKYGYMVVFGMAPGDHEPITFQGVAKKGKGIYYTAASPGLYSNEEIANAGKEIFSNIEKGVLRPRIHRTYPLSQAAQAHSDIESRKTTGSLVLIPDN